MAKQSQISANDRTNKAVLELGNVNSFIHIHELREILTHNTTFSSIFQNFSHESTLLQTLTKASNSMAPRMKWTSHKQWNTLQQFICQSTSILVDLNVSISTQLDTWAILITMIQFNLKIHTHIVWEKQNHTQLLAGDQNLPRIAARDAVRGFTHWKMKIFHVWDIECPKWKQTTRKR